MLLSGLVLLTAAPAWAQDDDLGRCLDLSPPRGWTARQHVELCRQRELARQRDELADNAAPADNGQPSRPSTRQEFELEKKVLLEAVRPMVWSLDEKTPYDTFVTRMETVELLVGPFATRFLELDADPAVGSFLESLSELGKQLRRVEQAWTVERVYAERVSYLTEQQRESAERRDPAAHPAVVASNLRVSIQRRDAATKERVRRLAVLRKLNDELVTTVPPAR